MEEAKDITVLNQPIESDIIEWAIEHPDCDSIIEHTGSGQNIRIFAYAREQAAKWNLQKYRNENYPGKRILVGMTKDGANSIS